MLASTEGILRWVKVFGFFWGFFYTIQLKAPAGPCNVCEDANSHWTLADQMVCF